MEVVRFGLCKRLVPWMRALPSGEGASGGKVTKMKNVEREREFHNSLAKNAFRSRKIINELANSFYDKKIVWANTWRKIGLLLPGKKILDYGCGTGEFSYALAARGATVYGIDVSEEAISAAESRLADSGWRIIFRRDDCQHTAFPDNYFDFIFGNGILHHLDFDAAMEEISRILKPGGKAFFMEPLNLHPIVRAVRFITPKARSLDETPLSYKQLTGVPGRFASIEHREYFLFSLLAAPFNLVSHKIGGYATGFLNAVDRLLFACFPWSRRYAWISLIQVTKPDGG
jgi:2-polyprenyl-3-methyl-5-hydroxy-6-metoxy-1,4-benzoquinol methylase